MELLGIAFIIILIGILGWMLIDRKWVNDWMKPIPGYKPPDAAQAYIRMWPKPKPVFHDQTKEWPDVFV